MNSTNSLKSKLAVLVTQWHEWAKTSDQWEVGWETEFPSTSQLVLTGEQVMLSDSVTDEELEMVALCWKITDVTGEVGHFAKAHLRECWDVLVRLSRTNDPVVRQQVYSVLGHGGADAWNILEKGLNDTDSFSRREALVGLNRINQVQAATWVMMFIDHPDPIMRGEARRIVDRPPDRADP